MSIPTTIEPRVTTEPASSSARGVRINIASRTEVASWLEVVPPSTPVASDLRWLTALGQGLRHESHWIYSADGERIVGSLPLLFVRGPLFGRFLVSLPYVNTAGVRSDSPDVARRLVDRAVKLADELDVRYLELRHETPLDYPALTHQRTDKVHMRLALPSDADKLWSSLKAKVRNQVRKGESAGLTAHWGGRDLLDDFYEVFSRNMRDLGTPVFAQGLFGAILAAFGPRAELCVVRIGHKPVAGALLIHEPQRTQVPSASSLRQYNATNANMWMYWQLLRRAAERGQSEFDFGRSTIDSNTYRFKKQWGAEPHPSTWQYHVRRGDIGDLRPDNPKYQLSIAIWRRLPVWLTRCVGPAIVRGIP
jgi:FemAB-related protein (PEP-CTERM system-associated)